MKIPFYYSFNEFVKNYETDLKKWLSVYNEANEKFYLEILQNQYGKYFDEWGIFNDLKIEIKIKQIDTSDFFYDIGEYHNIDRDTITFVDIKKLIKILNIRFSNYLNNIPFFIDDFENKPFIQIFKDCEILDIEYDTGFKFSPYGENDNYIINFKTITKETEKFSFFDFEYKEIGTSFLNFDDAGYENFKFSVIKIHEWVNEKTLNLDNLNKNKILHKVEIIESPEIDFSDNDDKVKLIILEKLGVINYIKSIQTKPETISHTAEILSSFTGVKSKSLYSYLRPMISPIKDDTDKNSPYKNPENNYEAEKTIHKLKIKNKGANQ